MNLANWVKHGAETGKTATTATTATDEPRTVATVATVATIATPQQGAHVIPICWPEFLQQCVNLGVSADEVRAMFGEVDIQDLCNEPPSNLGGYAQTIADAIKRERA